MGSATSLISIFNKKNNNSNTQQFINEQIKTSKDSLHQSQIFNQIIKNKEEKNYEYLVFSGGGLKGISYCGAVLNLEKIGILYNEKGESKIKGYAGTSIGSLFASLLAIGYKPSDLSEILKSLDLTKFFDGKLEMIQDFALIFENFGLCNGNYIDEFLGKLIKDKTGTPDYTFKQLYDDKQIALVVVGTDINYEKTVYFYHQNENQSFANIPIRKAIRISMSLPLIFHPVKYEGDLFVDGGILDNFPIHVFDGKYPGDIKAKLNLCNPNPKVLGLRIIPEDEEPNVIKKRQNIDGFFNYCISYINMFLLENERRIMTPANILRTIHIITPDYPLTDFSLSLFQKLDLVKRGMDYTDDYFRI